MNQESKKNTAGNIKDIYSLAPLQEGLLFHWLADKTSSAYIEQVEFSLLGEIDIAIFQESINRLIQRYDVLRTVFIFEKVKDPIQVILKERKIQVYFEDFTQKQDGKDQAIRDFKRAELQKGFDLSRDLLMRLAILKVGEGSYQLTWTFHHIIMDGWCLGIIFLDFLSIYQGLKNGQVKALEPVVPYREYIKWLEKQDSNQAREYWREYLRGYEQVVTLPTWAPAGENGIEQYKNTSYTIRLDEEEVGGLETIASETHITINTVLQGVWGILVQRYNNCDDVVYGTVVSGRPPDLKGSGTIVGLFINSIPVRIQCHPGEWQGDFFRKLQQEAIQSRRYEYLSLAVIQGETVLKNQLISHLMGFENYPVEAEVKRLSKDEELGFQVQDITFFEQTNYDFNLLIIPGSEITITFSFNGYKYELESVKAIADHYKHMLTGVLARPGLTVGDMEPLSLALKQQILEEYNRGDDQPFQPGSPTIHELFEAQVLKTPDHLALIGPIAGPGGQKFPASITYRELNKRAGLIASHLRHLGLGPSHIAGIMAGYSLEMSAVFFGIMKMGGVYLPLDPRYPVERLDFIIKDSGVGLVLTDREGARSLQELKTGFKGQWVDLWTAQQEDKGLSGEGILSWSAGKDTFEAIAYIIYTSGSTGRPKGVMVSHGSAVNTLFCRKNVYGFNTQDVSLQLFSYSFDGFVTSFFTPLISGARGVLLPGERILDMAMIGRTIVRQQVTHFICVPPLYREIIDHLKGEETLSLKVITLAGDVIPPYVIEETRGKNPLLEICNEYGVTEAAVMSTISRHQEKNAQVTIGRPAWNTRIYILDRWERVQPVGVGGELCISGVGVALGYLNNISLTVEKFTVDRYAKNKRMYHSGDLARWLREGNLELLGRIDFQVKIRGYRIEPGEIERQLLFHPLINEAVVVAQGKRVAGDKDLHHPGEEKFLCAYIVTSSELTVAEVKAYLGKLMPDYMIPAYIIRLEKIPLTPNGKLERDALPGIGEVPTIPGPIFVAPADNYEKIIANTWKEVLNIEQVGSHDNFFDLGGNSLTAVRVVSRLKQVFNEVEDIPVVSIFRYPTVYALAGYLFKKDTPGVEEKMGQTMELDTHKSMELEPQKAMELGVAASSGRIAVIGMNLRFPGANSLEEFWKNLQEGKDSVSFFTEQELEESGIPRNFIADPAYIRAKGVLEDIEYFDAPFFGYTPQEAELMDPQMRLFHESVWHALEDAGYASGTFNGSVGLYAGAAANQYWEALAKFSGKSDEMGFWTSVQFTDKDYLCTRVAYKLDLHGPAYGVYTACSTSLMAIHLGIRAVMDGECDLAVAGGITLTLPARSGYFYREGMVSSPEGCCRAFDYKAEGIVGGDGCGVVVFKKLEQALADGDHIYAVVLGTAANNDGIRKVGYTAPSVEGQAEVIRDAQTIAGIHPETIGYIEAHGTGTALGDVVEVEALKLAFNTNKKQFCGLGSVKTNVGHLDCAAGVAGFIKTVLALQNRQIPASIHFEKPNPKIDFENSPFYVNTQLSDWKQLGEDIPLRAGVSSFGIGGTNVHVVLEEAPIISREMPAMVQKEQWPQLLVLSAKSKSTLLRAAGNLQLYLQDHPGISLEDMVYTLQVGRKAFRWRGMTIGQDVKEIGENLGETSGKFNIQGADDDEPPVIFMFSGQGSQYVEMGLELYQWNSFFRGEMDRGFEKIQTIMGEDIRPILYPEPFLAKKPGGGQQAKPFSEEDKINQFLYTSPLKFLFEYSLARLLMVWGVQPYAMIGHSFGEYVAACLAGVFSLEDALTLVVLRGRVMHEAEVGGMTSVPLAEETLIPFLGDQLSLAAVNGPLQCIVSGPVAALERLENEVTQKFLANSELKCVRLRVPRASHSWMMNKASQELEQKARRVVFNKPRIPYISGLSGKWITFAEATDPGYYGRHLKETIRFGEGLKELLKYENAVFVQVGSDRSLSSFVENHPAKTSKHRVMNLVRHPRENVSDVRFIQDKIGRLWLSGKVIHWPAFFGETKPQRISLPLYPFARQRYWIEGDPMKIGMEMLSRQSGMEKKSDIKDWYYIPSWQSSALIINQREGLNVSLQWLLFINDDMTSRELLDRLQERKQRVIMVRRGREFKKNGTGEYSIDPSNPGHYGEIVAGISRDDFKSLRIIHLWNIVSGEENETDSLVFIEARYQHFQGSGFYSLIYLAQALGKSGIDSDKSIRIMVVSNGLQDVRGESIRFPERITSMGPVRVIPREYPNISCFAVDLEFVLPGVKGQRFSRLMDQLLAEFEAATFEQLVAYRGCHRLVETFAPVRLEKTGNSSLLIKDKGVYLVTGGLGGIGFYLAETLTQHVRVRLILMGRSVFPRREEWDPWLHNHDENDATSLRIRKIREWEANGCEIMICSADVSDHEQVQMALNHAEAQWGPIEGVVHVAGLPGGGLIQRKTVEMAEPVLATKIKGTLVLHEILQKRSLAFFILCSSASSIIPGFGQVDYCAANIFLDTFAHIYNSQGEGVAMSINWDRWQGTGMTVALEEKHRELTHESLEGGITPGEGMAAFSRLLVNSISPQVVILSQDLPLLIKTLAEPVKKSGEVPGPLKEEGVSEVIYGRPDLSSEYIEPGTGIERKIASIWERFFGLKPLGIQDDFFELGGDSLKATILLARIHKELNVRIPLTVIFENPTIHGLALHLGESEADIYASIDVMEEREYYELSSAQKRLYFLNQFEDIGMSYNVPFALNIEGDLDRQRFRDAFKDLIKRHEVLRTSFILIDNVPVQRIVRDIEFAIEELRLVPGKNRDEELERLLWEFIRPFDLAVAPLLRVTLVECTPDYYFLLFDIHHIIGDGTSIEILTDDLISFYAGNRPEPLRIQYKDFTTWQNHLRDSGLIGNQEKYWLEQYADLSEIPRLNLPVDYPRPGVFSFAGDRVNFSLESGWADALKKQCSARGTTLFMNLATVLNILLFKYTLQEDIVVGSTIAGRPHSDLQHIMGMFVNELAMRNHPQGSKNFLAFLEEIKISALNAYENQDVQFEDLVDRLNPRRDASRNPLFDICLVVQNFQESKKSIESVVFTPYEFENKTSKFDMTLFAHERENGILFTLEYYSAIFKKETIQRMSGHIINIIKEVVKAGNQEPGILLVDIDMVSQAERQEVIEVFNQTGKFYPFVLVHEQFAAWVRQAPGRIAVIDRSEARSCSYGELDARANCLANYLLGQKALKPEQGVGVLLDHCVEFIVIVLGILKAGGVYIPMDPRSPLERIKKIIDDAGITILISGKKFVRNLNRLAWECSTLKTYLCLDTADIRHEEEIEKSQLMDEKLWQYVADTATDDITAGGWLTSYTGQPFSRAEMDEYGDNVLKKVKPLLLPTTRVLEIGCASGLSMYRVAPLVAYYHGTDLSEAIIKKNRERVKQEGEENIALSCVPAHLISTIGDRDFDIIIINSVIQSFHGHNYLLNVIEQCLDLLKERGYLFIGDVMDQDLKKALVHDMITFKRENAHKGFNTKTDWSTELFVSRGFFQDLMVDLPVIRDVQFSKKIYTIENELTKFRYDTLITVEKTLNKVKNQDRIQEKNKYQEDLQTLTGYDVVFPGLETKPWQMAYIIYTSGTTGKPKGVAIEHQSLVNYVNWGVDTYLQECPGTFPFYTNVSFDLTVTSIFIPLVSGYCIEVYNEERCPVPIQKIVMDDRVNIVKATPSHLKLIQNEIPGKNRNLRAFILGGETLESSLACTIRQRFNGKVEIYNEYGPTEATVGCMIHRFDEAYDTRRGVSIGLPVHNTRIYILDDRLKPVPLNTIGEIFIGGNCLARGYINQPEMTAERFLKDSFMDGAGARMYRTGDLACRYADGKVEFLGRLDEQVKIRGYRIEIKEIEAQVMHLEGVKEALVIVRKDTGGDDYLCAYVVFNGCLDTETVMDWRETLSRKLPDYMIPLYFVQVEKIPLTRNGKVDKGALPLPNPQVMGDYTPPEDELEETVVEIWSEVLGLEKRLIGIDTSFFEIGGHSLKATVLIASIHKKLNIKIPLVEIFKAPTVRSLARYIKSADLERFSLIPRVETREYYVLSSVQKRLYILQQRDLTSTVYNMPAAVVLKGNVDIAKIENIFKRLIVRHECLRTSFIMIDQQPVQRVHESAPFKLEVSDLTKEMKERTITGDELVREFVCTFNLAQPPLMRLGLCKTRDDGYVLLMDMHHLISDGVSQGILIKDFMALYNGDVLLDTTIQYKDFAQWQAGDGQQAIRKQKDFWIKTFATGVPVLNLPIDFQRPLVQGFAGGVVFFELQTSETAFLKELALKEDVTLYMVLLALTNIFLARLSGADDIVVGTAVAGRRHADLQQVMGMFVNTLPLRNYPENNKTFSEFLKEIKKQTLDAFENQDYPFEDLVEEVLTKRDESRNPLFDVMLILQNVENVEIRIPGLTLEPYPFNSITSKFDLNLQAYESENKLHFILEYSINLFKKSTIEKFIGYFKEIVARVVAAPGGEIYEIKKASGVKKPDLMNQLMDDIGDE